MSKINIGNISDKLIDKKFVFYPTIITLITALIALILNGVRELFKETSGNDNNFLLISCLISFFFFMIGVCSIFFQIVGFNHKINEDINTKGTVLEDVKTKINGMDTDISSIKDKHSVISEIREHIENTKSIISPKKYISLTHEIMQLIENNKVNNIKIICYGTSGFDDLIPQLNKKYKNNQNLQITTNVLVCSPTSKYILHKGDKQVIKDLIKDNRIVGKINFVESIIPSTLRACILCDENNNPIWSSMQTYYYNCDTNKHSFDYQSFYTIIARKDNFSLLKEMQEIIEEEFKRLENFKIES